MYHNQAHVSSSQELGMNWALSRGIQLEVITFEENLFSDSEVIDTQETKKLVCFMLGRLRIINRLSFQQLGHCFA